MIPTSTAPVQVPFTANEPVFLDGVLVRRSGMTFEGDFFTDALISGNFPVCAIPGADKYGFAFVAADLRGAGVFQIFDTIPASLNATMPDLSISVLDRDVATRSFSWTASGADLGGLDMTELFIEWNDPMSGSNLIWNVIMAGDATNVTLPQLPGDLNIFEPPIDFAFACVEKLDFDVVTGFDDFITSISAMGGNLVSLALSGSLLKFAFTPE